MTTDWFDGRVVRRRGRLRLAAIERGVVMHARDLGKLKTWSQATAAAIGDLRGRRME
jgi:phosphatidylglycerophosphate synthase